jgi:hypothetical protein
MNEKSELEFERAWNRGYAAAKDEAESDANAVPPLVDLRAALSEWADWCAQHPRDEVLRADVAWKIRSILRNEEDKINSRLTQLESQVANLIRHLPLVKLR